jgi:hypothetical protein
VYAIAGLKLEAVMVAMHMPFPELTRLRLWSNGKTMPVIPDPFLGGSAPRLRYFSLHGVPFPGLPELLFSATHLVFLRLFDISHSGYISPEAIVALISVLSVLEELHLVFQSPQSRPGHETGCPPPSNRSVIPALSTLFLNGVIEYLEDLVTGIDTPQLGHMRISSFHQVKFDSPRLAQFISGTPKLGKREATVQFDDIFARVRLSPGTLEIVIPCRGPNWQLSSIEQVCKSSLHPLSTVEDLCIKREYSNPFWRNDPVENNPWLQLLLPFTTAKNLYLSKVFAPGIAPALQELVGGRITEVLPSLQNIFVDGLEPSGHWAVRCRATALQSPYRHFCLGQIL